MLPPLETTPILVLRWTGKALTSDLIPIVKKRLEQGGIIVLPNAAEDILLLTASQISCEAQAQKSQLIKPRNISTDNIIMDHFTVANRFQFKTLTPERDAHGLFTVHERSHLVQEILDRISTTDDKLLRNILLEKSHTTRTSTTSTRAKASGLRYLLQSHKWIDILTPLHLDEQKVKILKDTCFPLWRITPPIHDIQNYYGPSIAYYFAFMAFLGRWLRYLGILGLSVFLLRIYRNDTIDTDEYTPFYGLLCFIWAILFTRFWERQENRMAYSWGTLQITNFNFIDHFEQDYSLSNDNDGPGHRRPEFYGHVRSSPVTGLPEMYYPPIRRKLQYLFSAIVTICMLTLAFWVMILSLNLQGYIIPKKKYHPFHFPSFAILAEEGNWFDSASSWKCFIPVLIHVGCILLLNTCYRKIAKELTDLENHVTQDAYDNSLILKRFLFEAFDCYVVLFYLAFYERDVDRLRMELIAVFSIDSFRRLFMEVILPMVLHSQNVQNNEHPQDLHLEAYEPFDDYMEMLIQLGYVTLFASAYPLASLIMCAAVWIEIRSDCYKLTYLCQKPVAERVPGIRIWKSLLECMVWSSALTNCLLFGFTSDQMMHYMPSFYVEDGHGVTHLVQDKGWIAVFIIFALERVLIYFGLSLYAMVPSIPEDLAIELQRRRFLLSMDRKKTG
jgi:anoctamin-10